MQIDIQQRFVYKTFFSLFLQVFFRIKKEVYCFGLKMKQPLIKFTKPQPPLVAERLFHRLIWRLPQKEKTVFLTFDDGPVPIYTPEILDCLKQYNVPATFFCVGENITQHTDIFEQIIVNGHVVGSHTFNHFNGWFSKNKEYYENVRKGAKISGSRLFRPPYGKITFAQARHLSKYFDIVMWDVLSKDYDPNTSNEQCYQNIIQNVQNGSIVVLHDSKKTHKKIQYVLPKTIEWLLQNNYKLKAITPEIIFQQNISSSS